MKKILFTFIIFMTVTGIILPENFLNDNEYYKKGIELLNSAKQENEKGEYDKAYEYAEQAGQHFSKADDFNLVMVYLIRANTKKEIAQQTLNRAQSLGADSNDKSVALFNDAKNAFDEGDKFLQEGNSKEEFSDKTTAYQKAVDFFVESNDKAIQSLSTISDSLNNALKKLQEAKDKRAQLINNAIIKENDDTDKVIQNLIQESNDAFKKNNFLSSQEKSGQAINFMDKLALKDEANKMVQQAQEKLAQAKSKGAEKLYKNEVSESENLIKNATALLDQENYPDSINQSKAALEILQKFDYAKANDNNNNELTQSDEVFPKYYKVRLNNQRRDCFWRIAEFDFIYNNPFLWTVIYNANKDKLTHKDNPNLIYPSVILQIPSLKGEIRDGYYEVDKKYPKFDYKRDYNKK